MLRPTLGLHGLGLGEQSPSLVTAARLVKGVGMSCALGYPLELVPAAVGKGDRLLGVGVGGGPT